MVRISEFFRKKYGGFSIFQGDKNAPPSLQGENGGLSPENSLILPDVYWLLRAGFHGQSS